MQLQPKLFLPLLISVLYFSLTNALFANVNDSLHYPAIYTSPTNVETELTENYATLQSIIPHLKSRHGHLGEVQYILENYTKVEKLWNFYEEAKRDGKNLNNDPILKELTYLSKYTLYLLDGSLDRITEQLHNEPLRIALVKWKRKKLATTQQIYQKDKADLDHLIKLKPSVMENPMITNQAKLASLLSQRDSLHSFFSKSKVLGEFRKGQGRKIEEIDLFYACDEKKRASDNAPENIMDFVSDKAIRVIRLDREIYQFRLVALASLPYREQQYFKLKKELAIASAKEQATKRKMLKKKMDSTSHYALILKEYNALVDSFSFEEQSMLRAKEKVFNHEVISTIEFWGCPSYFPAFFEK